MKRTWDRSPIICSDGTRKTKFVILNEDSAQEYIEDSLHIAISITSPRPTQAYLDKHGLVNTGNITLPHNPKRLGALYLRFDDYSDPKLDGRDVRDNTGLLCQTTRLFREEDAVRILTLTEFFINDIETIVVNCQAGISRSAGVGAALAAIYYGKDADNLFFKNFHPNALVYSTLLKTYFGDPYEGK